MKDKSDNRFDYFIKSKLENISVLEKEDQWDKINATLGKRDFFKFSLKRFNIVYLLLLLVVFTSLLFIVFSKQEPLIKPNNKGLENIKAGIFKDSSIIVDSSTLQLRNDKSERRNNSVSTKTNSSMKVERNIENDLTKEEANFEIKPIGINDTISSMQVKSKTDTTTKPLIVKKVRYVTRRDTIIQIDTSRQRKKR